MSKKIRKSLSKFEPDDYFMLATGFVAICISVSGYAGWWGLSNETLIQASVAGIGILMWGFFLQSRKRSVELEQISDELNKLTDFEVIKFDKDGDAFEHMAKVMKSADKIIDHASLYRVPRKIQSASLFEEAYKQVILDNEIKVRYIADLSDSTRMERVEKFTENSKVEKYIVRSINSQELSVPAINFMIIDEKEVIFAIPGFGEDDTVISIKSSEVICAFQKYFNLIFSKSVKFEKMKHK